VPTTVCWEERCDILGGPFLIMEQIPGPTLLHWLLRHPWPWGGIAVARRMAELQLWLRTLPSAGFPHPPAPLLQRSLHEMQSLIGEYALEGLLPGLNWLLNNRVPAPPAPCIVHLDLHPLNLIHRPGRTPVVLDWAAADVGDPHADVATTLMILHCSPNPGNRFWERGLVPLGRGIVHWLFHFASRRRMDLDPRKLTYYQAWAALRRLCFYGQWLHAGPQATGAKGSLRGRLDADHVEILCRYFESATAVNVQL
jgi:aminoglycoside phosphotransferase (APT) family kinase protein